MAETLKLSLYDTMTREKREFVPTDPKRVTMYCCGPTVYSYAHIGNARAAVAADVLFRVLRHIYGEDHVEYARNITDIDDKIIVAAKEQGIDISEITTKFAKIYNDDLAALGCLMPTYQPHATEHMDDMVAMIEKLIVDGYAYESEGHVFFDVTKYDDYGKLSGNTLDQLKQGARVGEAEYARKKNAADFVLWKPSKEDDPSWDAPFGAGRPGWHIECSAMIKKTLTSEKYGETIDIHCGGQDLKFPHHENEIAQSNCAHNAPLANYWVHNGFLQMDAEKMSKSLGNVKLIHELLETWDGEVLRFALLSGQYRGELDWTDSLLKQAKNTLDGWYRILEQEGLEFISGNEPEDISLEAPVLSNRANCFLNYLCDDLNTVNVISELSQLKQNLSNGYDNGFDGSSPRIIPFSLKRKWNLLRSFVGTANLLGLLQKDPEEWFRGKAQEGGLTDAEIDGLIADRAQARADKDWGRSDEIRDVFANENIILEDGADGTTWRRG
ncbi:MAG: cysteine--tRNA ligase [Robiginitomaculum sp.]|nr:MAG: cysteine--tRNA ligase [Robiginitomaculum sp.]